MREAKSDMLSTILVIVLILLLLGAIPNWHGGGPWPAGGIGLFLLIVLILVLMGRI